ncbi:MAG: hypothetical protein WC497_01790 [Patescibacteria group bacterium]
MPTGRGYRPKVRVHVGPMYAEKTSSLYNLARRLLRARGYGLDVAFVWVKPSRDNREDDPTEIMDHDGRKLEGVRAVVIKSDEPESMLGNPEVMAAHVVFIDEIQFFGPNLGNVVLRLYMAGKEIHLAGLDTDHLGRPFPSTASVVLLPFAKVFKHSALCGFCGEEAPYSLRLINGRPAPADSPTFMVEHREAEYVPACLGDFVAKHEEVGNHVF